MKAKAILAPADNDGLEAVFYNFCGVGHSDMDGKGRARAVFVSQFYCNCCLSQVSRDM